MTKEEICKQFDVKIFTDNIEDSAVEQIATLMAQDVFSQSKVRIMPDVHAGAGCVIGFTGDLGERVIPNIVGVDIGCGMLITPFTVNRDIDYHALQLFIDSHIPSGRDVRQPDKFAPLNPKHMEMYCEAKELVKPIRCYRELKECKRIYKGIGTLGGGNHFIEIDRDAQGKYYLVLHTGSRNLGKQVAEIYQKTAIKNQSGWDELMEVQNRMIADYKAAGRRSELQEAVAKLHSTFVMRKSKVPRELCYVEGQSREDYLHDMRICQRWATINRRLISSLITDFLTSEFGAVIDEAGTFESVHNYIGDDNIIRKGAISAREGERCIIPLNMRDGSLICRGKGNPDWNYSAPHGAGRVLSRAQAFKQIALADFQQSMQGIYSETVVESTKDEAPMVYKPADEIIRNIQGTVAIENIIKPVFNFKAARRGEAANDADPDPDTDAD